MTLDDNGAPNGAGRLLDEWRNAAYNCFSSGHKFCREVCPVVQVTHDETHSPTAFHANVVAMDKGLLDIEDVAEDYVHCTQCGACELRCPNTIFAGDFYRFRTRTVDLVKAMRALAVDSGIHQPGWQRWNLATDELKNEPVLDGVSQERVADWAAELDLPVGGETILFCDCEAAFYRTSQPQAVAKLLRAGGIEFGLMREQWCCGGPAAEMGYAEQARRFAEHNVADWRAVGAKRILVLDPHDYITFTEDYPRYFGDDYDFEIVLVDGAGGRADPRRPAPPDRAGRAAATYHDAVPAQQAQGHPPRAARDHARDPGPDVRGRRPRDAVGLLLRAPAPASASSGPRSRRPSRRAASSRPSSSTSTCWCRPACGRSARCPSRAPPRAIEVCDLMELVAHAAGLQPLAGLDVAAGAG